MEQTNLPDEVEPEAGTFLPRVRPLQGEKFLINPVTGKIGNTRPFINNRQSYHLCTSFRPDSDFAMHRTEIDTVLDQVGDSLVEQEGIYEDRIIPRTEDTLKLSIADYRGKRTDFFTLIETYRELLMFETQLARIEATLAGTIAQIERTVGCPYGG